MVENTTFRFLAMTIIIAITTLTCVNSEPACDVADEAFILCSSDDLCRAKFFIHTGDAYDEERFHYLFSHYLFELNLNEEALNDTCPPAHPLWLPLLRQAFFCTDNEYWQIGIGCMCRHDKICHEISGKDILFDVLPLSFLVLLFIVIVVWCGILNLGEIRKLHGEKTPHHYPVIGTKEGFVFSKKDG